MKKLINAVDRVVTDALAGIAAAHPSLSVDVENKVITRAGGPRAGKVGLVSGGGSGHEPLHGGFVGYGMLDAACPGEVFTSPVPDQVLEATKAVHGGAGVLHIVYQAVAGSIAARGGRIARNLVGNYITSLEMQGFSVTVCALTPELTRLWDAPVDTAALQWGR
jgi:dihydroxyacetone kinase